jgi:N-acetylglutamate synthase-like GNAT family acetyltransferase
MNLGDFTPEGIASQLEANSPEQLIENSRTAAMFVAIADSKLVGLGGHDTEKIRTLFVDPSFHGNGIGSAVLSSVLADARQAGIEQLECWSTPFAERFYQRKGFTKVGLLGFGGVRFVRMVIDL